MADTPQHEHRGHAELSPSSSERWLECPGSVFLSRGLPNTTSDYADEGTAAHQLAEQCLRMSTNAVEFIGTSISVRGREWPVTREMADNVQVYVDHIRQLQTAAVKGQLLLEHRFTLQALDPPSPMHGTADCVIFIPATRTLYVRDLKYGAGVLVNVEGNSQLLYYALGALVSLGLQDKVDVISLGIIQPRADHPDGPIRVTEVSVVDLTVFGMDLLAGAAAALKPDAPLKAGKHCKFCKAKNQCPELRSQALLAAGEEFEIEAEPEGLVLPDPKLIPLEVVASYLPKLDLLEDWIKSLRQFAHSELEAGRPFPGYKLIAKRANRKWAVSEEEIIKLAKKNRLKKDQIFDQPSLLSPTKMEKLFQFPDSFVKKESSGTTLAAEADPRPAVISTPRDGSEFDLEEDPSDQ